MAKAQSPGKVKHSYQIDKEVFDNLEQRAHGLGISTSELVRRLIHALTSGAMKLPLPAAIKENYES